MVNVISDMNNSIKAKNLTVVAYDTNIIGNKNMTLNGINKSIDQPILQYLENNSIVQNLNKSVIRVKRNANLSHVELEDIKNNKVNSSLTNSSHGSDLKTEAMSIQSSNKTDENDIQIKKENNTALQSEVHNVERSDFLKEEVTSEMEMKQIQASSQIPMSTESISLTELSELADSKEFKKRSPYFEEIPNKLVPLDKSDDFKLYREAKTRPNSKIPTKNENTQYNEKNLPYPPTGPDGSNFAEGVKTSQQLTVANSPIFKPICFQARNSGLQSSSSYVCTSVPVQQIEYLQGINPDLKFIRGRELAFPSVTGLSSDLSSPGQNPIIVTPTNSPNIRVPTAISSPNPYFFPTVNGAPMFQNFANQFQQINPTTWSPNVAFPNQLNIPPVQSFVPVEYGPQYIVQGSQSGVSRVISQPYAQVVPHQQQYDYQNPVFCMYVPTQSHQFPVVNGVTEFRSARIENTSAYTPYVSDVRASKVNYKTGKHL